MDADRFNALVKEFQDKETMLLGIKKTEYANDQDRLINFKEVAQMTDLSSTHYCYTLMMKHLHSLKRAIITGEYQWDWNNEIGEGLKQRIADARNYLLLLAGLLEETESSRRDSDAAKT